MHTRTLKKLFLALTFWLALHESFLRAQTVSAPPLTINSTGTNPVDFEFRADGTLVARGNNGVGSLLSVDQVAGSQMLWYPGKSAFRAGIMDGWDAYKWSDANIGTASVAMGNCVEAAAYCSVSLGAYTTASSNYDIAIGFGNLSNGWASTSLGWSTSSIGWITTSFGYSTIASGNAATALGYQTTANGFATTSSGYGTQAQAYESFVTGAYNVGGGNGAEWIATDPLFEIGNGTDSSHPSDALLVDKSGNVTAGGVITAQPGGDIPMYAGN